MKIKKKLSKYSGLAVAVIGCVLILSNDVQAGWGTSSPLYGSGVGNAQLFGLPTNSVGGILETVLNWLLSIVGILGVIGFVVSGITYLTAYGDEKAIAKAKNMMTYSAMGVAVALIGLIVVAAIASVFQGGSGDAFSNSY